MRREKPSVHEAIDLVNAKRDKRAGALVIIAKRGFADAAQPIPRPAFRGKLGADHQGRDRQW